MKALVIAPQPFFSPRGTPFSVYYRTLVASELGVSVDLLTYGEGQDVEIPGVRIIRIPNVPFFGEVKIGPSGKKLLLDVLLVLWTAVLLIRNRYDFVHAHEESVFFCVFLKPLFGFRMVYDMHSSLPQQLTNFNFTTAKTLIGLFKWLEDRSLRAADAVITICPDLADYVNGVIEDPTKHFLIENSIFDPVRIRGRDGRTGEGDGVDLDTEEFLLGHPCVVYAGTLEHYQGVDVLIRAFETVASEHPDAGLVIVGGTPGQVAECVALAGRRGLDGRVRFTGRVSPEAARSYSNRAAVLVSCRVEGTNTPLKVYEQLASGIPLVATDIYSHTQVLDKNVSILVAPEPEAMAKGLLEALRPNGTGRRVAAGARKLYEEKYSRTIYEGKLRCLIESLA